MRGVNIEACYSSGFPNEIMHDIYLEWYVHREKDCFIKNGGVFILAHDIFILIYWRTKEKLQNIDVIYFCIKNEKFKIS